MVHVTTLHVQGSKGDAIKKCTIYSIIEGQQVVSILRCNIFLFALLCIFKNTV